MEALLEFRDTRDEVDFFLQIRVVNHRDWISAQQLDPFQELNEPPIAAGNRVAAEPRAPLEPGRAVALVRAGGGMSFGCKSFSGAYAPSVGSPEGAWKSQTFCVSLAAAARLSAEESTSGSAA